MSILEVKNFGVSYGQHFIFHDLSFNVEKGEFVAIIGKSGSGKSTLLHALAGLIPSSGIKIVPSSINIVFQQYGVYPWMTVEQNILLALHAYPSQQKSEVLEKYLYMIQLNDKKKYYPHQLSGGQVQRIAVARALASNPEVLFMDEPFGALDAHTREIMQSWLLDLWEKNRKTIIFVTHSIDEAVFLADRIIVMAEGNFIKDIQIDFIRPRHENLKFSQEFHHLKRGLSEAIKSSNNLFN